MSEFIGYFIFFAFLGACIAGFINGFCHADNTVRSRKRSHPKS